jgi:hypothetical protein
VYTATTLDSICILYILVLLQLFQNILRSYHSNTKLEFQSSVRVQNLNTIHRVICHSHYTQATEWCCPLQLEFGRQLTSLVLALVVLAILVLVKANTKVRNKEVLQFSQNFTKISPMASVILILVFESADVDKFT